MCKMMHAKVVLRRLEDRLEHQESACVKGEEEECPCTKEKEESPYIKEEESVHIKAAGETRAPAKTRQWKNPPEKQSVTHF
ncbi:uncharacterized protein LOC130927667 isoform X2 [Corythoichthys intestinalis]|uniref:uncharacterized protein LOC130927667 isoform X2 n=1 Tax=Corythoichthys intestinalis TaxID=161448 RepID=UPI0025A5C014|nr:uncharacterized protein LOC130927667 isoform X2 [Corythoichthys intestinalis]